jgi:hypothetical protein
MVVHTCNPSTWEAEAGESGVAASGLHKETLFQKHQEYRKSKTNILFLNRTEKTNRGNSVNN